MRRASLLLATLVLFAATPGEVVSELETRGYYIEDGSSATAAVVSEAVTEAGFAGGRLYIVVLGVEPDPDATFFSDAVLDELGDGTVLTVAPETVGYASDETTWSEAELDSAVDASLNGSSDDDVVTIFVGALTGTTVGGGGEPGGGAGSGSGWIWFFVFAGGFVIFFLYLRSRTNKTAATAREGRLGQFREAAQQKLDAVANDILEMEEEVRLSENRDIQSHYASASNRYAEVIDAIDRTTDPEQLLELTYTLDLAIWELDVAEAMLDGKTPPAKPERPVVAPRPAPGGDEPVITQPGTQPYDRRPQRQSSPATPDLGSILLAILASQTFGGGFGRGGGWTGAPTPGGGGGLGRLGGGGGRIRGGGRRRG